MSTKYVPESHKLDDNIGQLAEAIKLVVHFTKINKLPSHTLVVNNNGRNKHCGYYKKYYNCRTVIINIKDCFNRYGKNYELSMPGFCADRSPLGIYSHEIGHMIYTDLSITKKRAWRELLKISPKVSWDEINPNEAFAETTLLFMTNPVLLKRMSPQRYKFLKNMLTPPTYQMNPVEMISHRNNQYGYSRNSNQRRYISSVLTRTINLMQGRETI